jgi:serine/threonine-protein kinase
VYEYGEDADGTAYIAMEYVEGRELKDYFDQHENFPLPEVVRIMGEILDALGHAHENGIVHRDVKPANIFLLKDGRVKFCDFGIARIESSNLTQVGSVLGSPAYMSPEQFMGQRVDGRSDLFSAGVMLYQFLTGEKPFLGQLTTIMHKVLKEEPIPPSELNFQVTPAFDAVVRKSMAKRPDDRYQNAGEFAAALRAALSGQAVNLAEKLAQGQEDANHEATILLRPKATAPRSAPATAPGSADATMRLERPPRIPASPQPEERRRGIPVWAVAAGFAVLIAIGGGLFLWQGKGGMTSSTAATNQKGSESAAIVQRMVQKNMMGLQPGR